MKRERGKRDMEEERDIWIEMEREREMGEDKPTISTTKRRQIQVHPKFYTITRECCRQLHTKQFEVVFGTNNLPEKEHSTNSGCPSASVAWKT